MSVPGSPQYVFNWYLDLLRKDTLKSGLTNTTYHAIFLVQAAADAIIAESERMQIDDVRAALSVRFPFLSNRAYFDPELGIQSGDLVIAKTLWEALHLEEPGPTGLYTLGKPGVLDRWRWLKYAGNQAAADLVQPLNTPKEAEMPTFDEYFSDKIHPGGPWSVASAAEFLEVEARRRKESITVMFNGFPLTCSNNITAAYAVMNWYSEARPKLRVSSVTQMTEETLNRVWNNPMSRKLLIRAFNEAE
jgi:hypothetical protein